MEWRDRWLAAALYYLWRHDFSVLPMGWSKKPLVEWKHLQERRPTWKEIVAWPRENVAIITGAISGVVVVDCESAEDARWFKENKLRGRSTAIVKTRRGYHFYFQHPGEHVKNAQRVRDKDGNPRYDVRGDGGYVLAPPSRWEKDGQTGEYAWHTKLLRVEDLPAFRMEWRPETVRESTDREISDVEAYIAKIVAKSGEGGHNQTYKACQRCRDAGLSEGEALLVMQRWNQTNAQPPWSDRELLHKVRSAYSAGT